ncbi:MAG: extracellular solute-binding protein [Clostridiales bacterium]|jgi:spermidine/putrescine transport system substrate-binding protein|nr:extracellular solute-binding protein [Clostridiales bacterium]
MKKAKILILFLIAVILLPILASCDNKKDYENVLRIYNWADYINEDVLTEFKNLYNVEIEYEEFDTNETMLTKLEKGKEYYDLICPSDYMIQRLIKSDLIQQLDYDRIPNYQNYSSAYINDKFAPLVSDGSGNKYAIGYTWGVMGILYNIDNVNNKNKTEDEINSWELLFDPDFKNEVYMKDSIRDTFAALSLYAYRERLTAGYALNEGDAGYEDRLTPEYVLKDSSDEILDKLVQAMREQKNAVNPSFEVDEAKNEMAEGKYSAALMWNGDAYAAIEAGLFEFDKDGNKLGLKPENNRVHLGFALPKEGNNIFFDGFAIPKQNRSKEKEDLIYKFLDFISHPDNALNNVEYIGYTSVIAGDRDNDAIFEYARSTGALDYARAGDHDVSYFFPSGAGAGTFDYPADFKVSEILYPDREYIEKKCAVMYDYGGRTQDFNDAWVQSRGENFPGWAIALIVIGAVIAVCGALAFIFREKLRAFIGKKFPSLSAKKPAAVQDKPKPTGDSPSAAREEPKPAEEEASAAPISEQPSDEGTSGKPREMLDDEDDDFIPPVK